ncbi:hypothetical protein B0H14DRAFT_2972070, partial [Mycena olivaceomarginata]
QLKAPLSFTTNPKHHTPLRPSSAFPPEIPPTWTLSLASVTADLTISLAFPSTTNYSFSAALLLFLLPKHGDAPARAHRVSSRRAVPTHRSRVRRASPSPMRTSMGIVPPTCVPSVLPPGSEGVDPLTFLPLSTPAPHAPLPFITIMRARSSSRESAGSSGAAMEMPALVATLLLRRWEGKQTGAGARRTFVPRLSKLRMSR